LSRLYNCEAEGVFRRPELRLTLDTPEDYRVIKGVFEALYPHNHRFTARDMIVFLDANPSLRDFNRNVVQRRYEYEH